MNSLLNSIADFFAISTASTPNGVARKLMENAEASAGRDPHQAQELRQAAYAYLSVIR